MSKNEENPVQKNGYDISVNLNTGNINYFYIGGDIKVSFFETSSGVNFDSKSTLIKIDTLELIVSQVCNMNCTYCFANQGIYDNSGLMTLKTAKRSLDLLHSISDSDHLKIAFFGGEPFLNFDLIKEVVIYANKIFKDRKLNFVIATNGTIINREMLEFIKNNSISIQVSIDGKKDSHDKYRTFNDGMPTYEKIFHNVKSMKEFGIEPVARATISHKNMVIKDFIPFSINDLNLRMNFWPIMSKDNDLLLNPDDYVKMYQEFLEIYNDMIDSSNYKLTSFNKVLRNMILYHFETDNSSSAKQNSFFCGAGTSMISIDISGNIYPCHGFVGDDQFNMGNINAGINFNKLKRFVDHIHLANKNECFNCIARDFCGGGCSYRFYFMNHDLNKPSDDFCGFIKTMYKFSIILYVYMKDNGLPKELLINPCLIELYDLLGQES